MSETIGIFSKVLIFIENFPSFFVSIPLGMWLILFFGIYFLIYGFILTFIIPSIYCYVIYPGLVKKARYYDMWFDLKKNRVLGFLPSYIITIKATAFSLFLIKRYFAHKYKRLTPYLRMKHTQLDELGYTADKFSKFEIFFGFFVFFGAWSAVVAAIICILSASHYHLS